MATSGTLGSCKRFNNNKTRAIGFQQQTNKLYMVGGASSKNIC